MNDDNAIAIPGPPNLMNEIAYANSPGHISDPNRIVSFSDALVALRRHTFKNVTDFTYACQEARKVHLTTFWTINKAEINSLQAARGQLNHSDNFLAYISVLHATLAIIPHDSPLVDQLLEEYRRLVVDTPPEWAKAVPNRWVGVNRHAARLVIERRDIVLAHSLIRPLREAVVKSAPAPDYLVPLLADFLAVCLQARNYKLATSWISEHRRLKVDVPATGLVGTDVHLYHHYSALAFTGVQDFRAALQCCRLALSVPAPSPGNFYEVACATSRLFILLNLLVSGKVLPPLKFSSYQTSRLRKSSSEYMEIAYAFEKRDKKQLHQIIESNKDLFEKHGNLGLVKQVAKGLSKQLILRLTKSFVTLRLEDVTARAGLLNNEEAHSLISEMIEEGKINASIEDRHGIVRLMENDLAEEDRIAQKLSREYMNDCVSIVQKTEAFRESIENDPNYVAKVDQSRLKAAQGLGTLAAAGARAGGIDAEILH